MDILGATVLDHVQNWIHSGGYYVLFGLLFACGLGLPLPEDIPLILAGYFVANDQMHLWIASIVAWFGIIGGDCVLYSLGKRYGLGITKVPIIGKHVTAARIKRAEGLFVKYGVWVVGVGRMFAGIRGAMVIAAGTIRFNFIKFLIADGLGAIISGGLFLALGYWAGKKLGDLNELRTKIQHYEHYVLAGLGAAVVLIVLYFWWRSRRHKTLAESAVDVVEGKIESESPKSG
ncbi:MAG: DedA family protein [Phycisphaerales bacterium]|jgi:membrane protein DedA with SNARE-associated domain|nr:DedA family protein [Phycisphaerales bacterium]